MADLDDAGWIAKRDPQGMLAALSTYEEDFRTSYLRAAKARLKLPKACTHVVVTGMGGSGIGGNLLASLVRDDSRLPVLVHKGYGAPAYIGKHALVVAVSYSGETEETLDVSIAARAAHASLITVSSGGRLQRMAHAWKVPHLAVPAGRQPRAALSHLFGTLAGAARGLGLTSQSPVPAVMTRLRAFHATLGPDSRESENPAKSWARDLHRASPVWVADTSLAAVALRARCQLNENAKMMARSGELPESNHNELVALSQLPDGGRYFVGFMERPDAPPEIRHRFEFVQSILRRRGVAYRTIPIAGSTALERLLHALLFVDYVSVYAALLRGVDPTPVLIIDELKALLAKHGRLPAIRGRFP